MEEHTQLEEQIKTFAEYFAKMFDELFYKYMTTDKVDGVVLYGKPQFEANFIEDEK